MTEVVTFVLQLELPKKKTGKATWILRGRHLKTEFDSGVTELTTKDPLFF
jgi:hypothetical protein